MARTHRGHHLERSRRRGSLTLVRGLFLVLSSFVVLSLVLTVAVKTQAEVGAKGEDADFPDIFQQIDRRLERSYLDLDRIQPRPLVERALSSLELSADEIYVEDSDPTQPYVSLHVDDKVEVYNLLGIRSREDSVSLLEKVFSFLGRHYQGESTLNDLRYAAANGYLSGVDPHTLVFPPRNFEEFEVHIRGEIFGVGMMVGQTEDGRLQVKQVLKDTPAFGAGFKKNDLIVKIDDESAINMTVMEAVQKIRGPKGTEVVLTVKRRSSREKGAMETIPIAVKRDRVQIKSVESKLIRDEDGDGPARGGVGYVQVTNFDQKTRASLVMNLRRLRQQNGGPLVGLILDLRGNSGGLLTQAIYMADLFLKRGDIVVQARKFDILERTAASDDGYEPDYPIILLADEGSASGAEIVLGALQKNNRGLVLGNNSFGKGSVQQLQSLSHGAQLKITVSEYLIPGDISIQENGVVPDILAQAVILDDDASRLFPSESVMKERDYETHIVSKYKRDEQPRHRLKYLYKPIDEETTASERFISGELQPEKDPLVQMALRVLALAEDPWDPRALLSRRSDEIGALGREFFAEIVQDLAKKDIDWSAGPEGASVSGKDLELVVEHRLTEEPSQDEDDPLPDQYIEVTAKLTNRGKTAVHRLKGISDSEFNPFKEHEFLFGKVRPGQTVERTRRLALAYYTRAQSSAMRLVVSGPDGKEIVTGETTVVLPRRPRPAFAYTSELRTTGGQRLGKLPKEADVVLALTIHNVGEATSEKGIAILRNKTGRQVFLESGRPEFSSLEPGGSTEVEFRFKVRPGGPVDAYKFELVVFDSYSSESLVREIEILPEGKQGEPYPNGVRFEPPRVDSRLVVGDAEEGVEGESLLVTDEPVARLVGQVASSTQSFKAWITNLPLSERHKNPDKVYFKSSGGRDRLRVDARVRLERGLNLVTLVAKDQSGLERRNSLLIRRR